MYFSKSLRNEIKRKFRNLAEANKPAELEEFLCSKGYKVIRDFSPHDLLFIRECKVENTSC